MFQPFTSRVAHRLASMGVAAVTVGAGAMGSAPAVSQVAAVHPLVATYKYVGSQAPTPEQCANAGLRCFSPASMQNSYNLGPLYALGKQGQGQTIAVIDSFGSNTIRTDLNVFNSEYGLKHLCGEANYTCAAGDPTFSILSLQGSPPAIAQPPNNGTQQENKAGWSPEVTLDVDWAHAIAPMASILLVTTPTAEVLGVQGFPQMMAAEDYVIKHHLASVISQSLGSTEEAFNSTASLERLRYAFKDAQAAGVTVLASSGDFGTANVIKTPTTNRTLVPYPTVSWPASDPLVTAVGGTSLCTDAATGRTLDSVNPPASCQLSPGEREVTWNNTDPPPIPGLSIPIATGGGFSHQFARPAFQSGVTSNSMRGIPDVAYNADPFTGVTIYISSSGNEPGWWVIGGTSAGSPQWAGLVAIASQLNGAPVGYINPALYKIGQDPARYARDFFDVTVGNNQVDPSIPGYAAARGWDPVTGWGTPNAALLLPDLVRAIHGN